MDEQISKCDSFFVLIWHFHKILLLLNKNTFCFKHVIIQVCYINDITFKKKYIKAFLFIKKFKMTQEFKNLKHC